MSKKNETPTACESRCLIQFLLKGIKPSERYHQTWNAYGEKAIIDLMVQTARGRCHCYQERDRKASLGGKRFYNDDDVQQAVNMWFK